MSDILPEEVEEQVKEAAEISMGTEITEDDITNIQQLCDQVSFFKSSCEGLRKCYAFLKIGLNMILKLCLFPDKKYHN